MPAPAGKRNIRVKIFADLAQQDAYGQPAGVGLIPLDDRWHWARVLPSGGAEPEQAEAPTPTQTTTLEMRHVDGVTPSMHLETESGRRLNIEHVTDPQGERGEWMHLVCRELR